MSDTAVADDFEFEVEDDQAEIIDDTPEADRGRTRATGRRVCARRGP